MPRNHEAHRLVLESLTQALIQLMEQKPLREINISELCDRAGVSRVSFYRNFNSMEDILVRHLNRCTEQWWEAFSQKPSADFYREFWPSLLEEYRKNSRLIQLISNNNANSVLWEHISGCVTREASGDERDAYLRSALAGALYGMVTEWIRRGMEDFPQDFHLMGAIQAIWEQRA